MAKKDLKALREAAKAKFAEAKKFADDHGLNDEDGDIKAEDMEAVNKILTEAKQLDAEFVEESKKQGVATEINERFAYYSEGVTDRPVRFHPVMQENPNAGKSLGRQFVESQTYQDLIESGDLKSTQTHITTKRVLLAATDIVDGGTGADLDRLVLPDYLPGIIPLQQRPLVVRDLFDQRRTNSDIIDYAQQSAFESGADAVAKATAVNGVGLTGGVKPQSSIDWERKQKPVTTIATFFVTTRQSLADSPVVEGLIDNQGRLMIQLAEEDQIISGDGVAPNLEGLMNTPGVQTLDVSGSGAGAQLDAIRVARRLIRTGASRLQADGVILHPEDSEAIDLMKDDNGLYRGGNPVGNFTYNQPLWGLRRVESEGMGSAGVGIVGAFKAGGTVYERQGITVYTTDSHSDFFIRNLIAVLFEERIGLAVFFPSAFVIVTFSLAAGSGDIGVQT